MATKAQILANQRNAQKSTGPRTLEGKAVVSRNAVKHGLTAANDIIGSEDKADFDLHRNQMLDELAPISPMESILAERIISLSWRLKRADRIQNQAIDALNERNTSNPLTKLTQSLSGRCAPSPELALGHLAVKDFSNERVLERLLMYEQRLEHSLYKTILEIQRLNVMRQLNPRRTDNEETAYQNLPSEKL